MSRWSDIAISRRRRCGPCQPSGIPQIAVIGLQTIATRSLLWHCRQFKSQRILGRRHLLKLCPLEAKVPFNCVLFIAERVRRRPVLASSRFGRTVPIRGQEEK